MCQSKRTMCQSKIGGRERETATQRERLRARDVGLTSQQRDTARMTDRSRHGERRTKISTT